LGLPFLKHAFKNTYIDLYLNSWSCFLHDS